MLLITTTRNEGIFAVPFNKTFDLGIIVTIDPVSDPIIISLSNTELVPDAVDIRYIQLRGNRWRLRACKPHVLVHLPLGELRLTSTDSNCYGVADILALLNVERDHTLSVCPGSHRAGHGVQQPQWSP
jgi:hypothetical protein